MKKHFVVAFLPSGSFEEAGSTTFNLYSATGFLLDVLDVRAAMADDLGAKVKPRNGLKANGDTFLGPFALHNEVS